MNAARKTQRRMRVAGATALALSIAAGCTAEQPPSRPTFQPTPYSTAVLNDKPVAYWRLDETEDVWVFDRTDHGNTGQLQGKVLIQQPGAIAEGGSYAMAFDGLGARINIPDAPSLQITSGSLTIECWIKPTEQAGDVFILSKGEAGVQTEYGLLLSDGVLAYQSVVEMYPSKALSPVADAWTHVAVTITRNRTGRLYLNGTLSDTFSIIGGHGVTAGNHPFSIGGQRGTRSGFRGAIDEVAVYDRALPTERIAQRVELRQTSSVTPSFGCGLVAFFLFPSSGRVCASKGPTL
jgi:Concanavalin A-like lectin/glucanases superfamily